MYSINDKKLRLIMFREEEEEEALIMMVAKLNFFAISYMFHTP